MDKLKEIILGILGMIALTFIIPAAAGQLALILVPIMWIWGIVAVIEYLIGPIALMRVSCPRCGKKYVINVKKEFRKCPRCYGDSTQNGLSSKHNSAELIPITDQAFVKHPSLAEDRDIKIFESTQDPDSISVLVVNDVTDIRKHIRNYLEKYANDIKVIGEAGNGKGAIALYEELHPDVVCMNICMPVMDGIAATSLIC